MTSVSLYRDLKTYQDTVVSFGLPALSERFEFLRQLGNVFLVRPEILKSYITENYLGRIEPALLKPYLAQRSDWAQFERAFDFSSPSVSVEGIAGGEPTTPTGTSMNMDTAITFGLTKGMSGFRDRFNAANVGNRLSTMMRDLESVRIGGSGFATPDGGTGRRSRTSLNGLSFSSYLHPSSASSLNGPSVH